MFEPAPPVPVTLTDPALVKAKHRAWEYRMMVATIIGYATFYFVRKNLSMAMPVMEKSLGIDKAGLGLIPDLARRALRRVEVRQRLPRATAATSARSW